MSAQALLVVGEHLELVSQIIKSQAQAAAEHGASSPELEQLCTTLSKSTAALHQQCEDAPLVAAVPTSRTISGASSDASSVRPVETIEQTPQTAPTDDEVLAERPSLKNKTALGSHAEMFKREISRWQSGSETLHAMEKAMESNKVEFFFAGVIVLNVIFMIIESQTKGIHIGTNIGYSPLWGSQSNLTGTWDTLRSGPLVAIETMFAVVFTIELILRLVLLRMDFLREPWAWLDITVVLITDFIQVSEFIGGRDFMNIAWLRGMRLIRLLRIVRLARKIQTFDSLYLMTAALWGSLSVLFWVIVLLFIIQTLFALALTNIVQDFYLRSENTAPTEEYVKEIQEIYMYFGTYWRSMVSLFELMLANWPPICRMMMKHMYEGWSFFVVAYKLTLGFAVIGVIMGVFTQETFRAAETDDQLLLRRKAAQSKMHTTKMRFLFNKMKRVFESDTIDAETFATMLANKEVSTWLKALDYDTSDANMLFQLIDKDGDGTLSVDELIEGMASLKGTARNMDVKLLLHPVLLEKKKKQNTDKKTR